MGKISIAIDGPASSGKSTVAKILAKQLNYVYCDTGPCTERLRIWPCKIKSTFKRKSH